MHHRAVRDKHTHSYYPAYKTRSQQSRRSGTHAYTNFPAYKTRSRQSRRSGTHAYTNFPAYKTRSRQSRWSGTHKHIQTSLPTRLAHGKVAGQGHTNIQTSLPTRLAHGKVAGQGHTNIHKLPCLQDSLTAKSPVRDTQTYTNFPAYKTRSRQSRRSGTHKHIQTSLPTRLAHGKVAGQGHTNIHKLPCLQDSLTAKSPVRDTQTYTNFPAYKTRSRQSRRSGTHKHTQTSLPTRLAHSKVAGQGHTNIYKLPCLQDSLTAKSPVRDTQTYTNFPAYKTRSRRQSRRSGTHKHTQTSLPTRLAHSKVAGQGHTNIYKLPCLQDSLTAKSPVRDTQTYTNFPAYKTRSQQSRRSGTHKHTQTSLPTRLAHAGKGHIHFAAYARIYTL